MSGGDLRERHDEYIVFGQWGKRGTYHVNRYSTKVGYSFPGGDVILVDSFPCERRRAQRTFRGGVCLARWWGRGEGDDDGERERDPRA